MTDPSLAAIETSLRRRFRVVQTNVRVGARNVSLLHPASAEELIDEEAFEQDERLPYWAELWPSSRVMAERILESPGEGRTLLELGCGSGLVSTCASIAGYDVVASDYYEDAVRFARVNAPRNRAPAIRGLVLDWRHLPAELARFNVIVASDVLYERPYGALIAQVLDRTLADDGVAFVADPGRVGREAFLEAIPLRGLQLVGQTAHPFIEGDIRQTITVFQVGRAG